MNSGPAYLDTSKSVVISSPAGSGKTEKLASRYIALLDGGTAVEKILCITFTEKAAAEMKERILNKLQKEHPGLLADVKDKIPLMRITTIHSFCLRLLKRFTIELGLDPGLSVMDEAASDILWTEAVYESLMFDEDTGGGFFNAIKSRGIRGWGGVKDALDEIKKKSPLSDMMLDSKNRIALIGDESRPLLDLYGICLDSYRRKKLDGHLLDFSDLEYLAYKALSLNVDCHNILYSFDEHTDHLLVDEFQDTNSIQWRIIDKLTEEWRAGMGAKRDKGRTPTIFLVGDEKQSIYQFRGANVSIFQGAKDELGRWLGEGFRFEAIEENYRSLPNIVKFVNELFSEIMVGAGNQYFMTKYEPFRAKRDEAGGHVELLLFNGEGGAASTRAKESMILAKKIKSIRGLVEIFENKKKRPCDYGDMAILLRKRTHLSAIESGLRGHGVPFIVLKGVGFFDETETALLIELISFLCAPHHNHSLFCVLRSPLFDMKESTLFNLMRGADRSLYENLKNSDNDYFKNACEKLDRWLNASRTVPLQLMIEDILTENRGWSYFSEPQRAANVKKFITLIESYYTEGLSNIEIRERLLRQRDNAQVAKANINAEGMNAVKIMTIHAAKGLQFPIVFLPSLDESISPRSTKLAIDESDDGFVLALEEDSKKREKMEPFKWRKLKEEQEEKRLFYVALTRAMDYLCMTGALKEKNNSSRLAYISDAFGIFDPKQAGRPLPFEIIRESGMGFLSAPASTVPSVIHTADAPGPLFIDPVEYAPPVIWSGVTTEIKTGRKSHGRHWTIVGTVMHKLFEELSCGTLKLTDIEERAVFLLKSEGGGGLEELCRGIIGDNIGRLDKSGLLKEIILPRDNAHSELPFVYQKNNRIYSGRVDRVIIVNNEALVYDYKTFPVEENEIKPLTARYEFQLQIYKEAVSELFKMPARAFVFFTNLPKIAEV